MSVLISPQTGHARPIIISRPEEKIDPDALGDQLADLARRRRITHRDERLLEHLLAAGVLSLDQIRRLLWPTAKAKTAADRLSKLWNWHLLRRARQPWAHFPALGLAEGPVFGLGVGGWWWLCESEPERYAYRLIEAHWVWRHLLAAELYTRLAGGKAALNWQPRWQGLPAPFQQADPLAVVTLRLAGGRLATLALELTVAEKFHIPPKLKAYDELAETGQPVTVMLVLSQSVPLEQVAATIRQERRQAVTYLLAGWEQLLAAPDLLTRPVWLVLDRAAPRRAGLLEALDG